VIRFISQAVRHYRSTGSVAPSSRFLGRTMVKSMPMTKNQRILEVGSGTGSVTKHILANLQDGDSFHIVELNTEFCLHLEQNLLEPFRKNNSGNGIEVVLHNTPIEEAELEGKFDTIICSLPFNNFPIELVQHLFDVMFGLLLSDGELVYFEYFGMRWLKRVFGFPSMRKETKLRTTDIQARFEKQQGCQCAVWRNIPSCRVVRLKR
jgi:phosphatidylethanolamine/phosphatidyl-N-methylethanolamine N-methyltransferase